MFIASKTMNEHNYISVVIAIVIVKIAALSMPAQQPCKPDNQLLRVVSPDGSTGFVNRDGRMILSPEDLPDNLAWVGDFYDGLASIAIKQTIKASDKLVTGERAYLVGYINTSGKLVIKPQFQEGYSFCDRLAFAIKEEVPGYIDRTGKMVIDIAKNCRSNLHDIIRFGRCPIDNKRTRDEWGGYSEGLIAVATGSRLGAKFGFADTNGNIVIPYKFEPEFEHHGFVHYLSKFSDGLARVKTDMHSKYGYINKKGSFVIKPQFERANNFSEGLAFVINSGEIGFIDKKGKWAIKADGWTHAKDFSEGMAAVATFSRNGDISWGYIDRNGKKTINAQFDEAGEFVNGVARIYEIVDPSNAWESNYGWIDKSGHYIWQPHSNIVKRRVNNKPYSSGRSVVRRGYSGKPARKSVKSYL